LIGPEAYRSNGYFEEIVGRVYVRYQELLVENNAMDFDDLLMRAVILFRKHPDVLERYRQRYRWVLVDEFQDTNTAQYVLVRLLTEEHRNLFAVGDEDQSIYLFRGADYRNVRRFEEDYPERIRILLEENYRSTQHILDAAGAVIRHNRDRTPKKLFTARKGGPLLTVYEAYNENDEAARVVEIIRHLVENGGEYQPRDVAVMYRTNAQSRALEEAFLVIGMPYRLVGATRFYGRREIKDLIAYLRIAHNPEDTVSLMRIINTPPRRIGTQTVEALTAWATATGRGLSAALMALLDDRHDTTEKPPFSAPAARALRHFASLVAEWQALRQAQPELSPAAWLDKIIDNVGYQAYIDDGTREGQERWENVQELCAVATEYAGLPLSTFLEEVALISDVDTRDDQVNAPSLMTLHSAKGLEFPAVFIVGLEEGLLPHNRSFDDPDAMAEERRLMYVGLTRAKNRLYLSYAFRRSRWGESEVNEPSRFLRDIPVELIEGSARLNLVSARQRAYYRQAVAWNPAPAPAVAPQYKTGQRVRHATFGEGVVVESRVSGGDEEVTVAFGDVGIKRLMASFANLERLEG
jgi:DNA helicase-2/ATP-dependent DNA helicase PcrA